MKAPIIGLRLSWCGVAMLVTASCSPQLFWGLAGSGSVAENGYHQWKDLGAKKGGGMKLSMFEGLYKRQRVWNSREEVRKLWTEGKGRHVGGE